MSETPNNQADDLTFEEALRQLEDIVSVLERGDISLDQAIAAYEKGTALKHIVKSVLKKHALRLKRLMCQEQGKHRNQPKLFDPANS